ncbi:MAG: lysoplasmalogenase [Bacilli bacterium]|nr:lysoplasmalogenase [Bacilli bacterium]
MVYLIAIPILMLISMSIYMYYHFRVKKEINLLLKLITSFWFVLLGIVAIFLKESGNVNYCIMMFAGLISGFIGDAILGLKGVFPERKKIFFCLGLIMFFVGHVFYSRVFFEFSSYPNYIYFFIALVLTVLIIILLEITHVELGKLKFPNYAYIYISSFLLTTAILGIVNGYSIGKLIALIGVLSFVLSDFLLSYLYFKKIAFPKFKVLKYINIITYYSGQILLALSIYFLL